MTNKVLEGDVLVLPAPYDRLSGQGALIGSIFGVAMYDVLSGRSGTFEVKGVFNLEKAIGTGSIAVGARLYWDNTAKKVTNTSTSNTLIGVALEAATSNAIECRVRLNGSL